ncbi:hypothetical protein ACM5ME_20955 [Bacillus subtilis]|uniref:LexA family protein n=1 Tax=Bacillus TaxID=1386 RepID=UPI003AAF369B
MRKITERQFETLQVIEKYINEKGFAPTYRELINLTEYSERAVRRSEKKRICNLGSGITKNIKSY